MFVDLHVISFALLTKREVWDNVYGFDFTPLKDTALAEPLVDSVDLKACVTDPCRVFEIDLYTVTASDLAFQASFSLKVRRPDFIHALIAWFDIEFSACHKPIKFSTWPHAKYTHWKQTVFYLRETLTVEDGEEVTGVLTSKPNNEKKRDLDIAIEYQLQADDSNRDASGSLLFKMLVSDRQRGVKSS